MDTNPDFPEVGDNPFLQPDLTSPDSHAFVPVDFDSLVESSPPVVPWDENGNLTISLHGQPLDSWTQQTTGFTCAVVSQKMILDAFGIVDPDTGSAVSEARLVYDATSRGWLTDGGTSLEDMGDLLELYGVDCHHGQGMEQMVGELAQGHKVIVGVDADELWRSDHWIINGLNDLGGGTPNHAIVVEGIRTDAHGNAFAVVNDPGDPDGAGREYPIDEFVNAFRDSGFQYVATDQPPPGLALDPQLGPGFDPASGHYSGWQDWIKTAGEFVMDRPVRVAAATIGFATLLPKRRQEILREI